MRVLGVNSMKYVLAAVLAAGLVWLGLYLDFGLPGAAGSYGLVIGVALICAGLTTKVTQTNWVAVAVVLAVAALMFWFFGQSWAIYGVVIGLGLVAGTLAALAVGDRSRSPASA